MIPSEIIDLKKGAMIGHIGSRDKNLQGTEVITMWFSAPGGKQFTAFLTESLSGPTLANLTDNKKIAVVYTNVLTHDSYQLKGNYISHRPATAEELTDMKDSIDRFYTMYMKPFGYPPEIINTFSFTPSLAVTFDVEEAFIQTPGPKASTKLELA